MIPRLICWLFGHKDTVLNFSGETTKITDNITGYLRTVPVMIRSKVDKCERCGEMLK